MGRMKRIALLALVVSLLAWPSSALAAPSTQTLSAGAVVALKGTPHIWIFGSDGVLHWGGDTRALAGKTIDWNNRREVGLDELKTMQRGDPWLSSGLVKSGDPIYLSKWETSDTRPTLLHIQSIADVELFGINGSNYGRFVIEQGSWEQQYRFSVNTLTKAVLAAAGAPGSTREIPVPLGTAAQLDHGWKVTIHSVTPNANSQITAANQFNKAPAAGQQFFIARISATRTAPTSGRYGPYELYAVGASNVSYTSFSNSCGVIPDPVSSNEVFPGGTVTGNVCWAIASSDAGSLVAWDNDATTRVYFALR